MFAVYASAPNPESPLDALVVGERPDPEAPEGWVPVTVTAASLNMHDIWTLRGVGIKKEQFPMILGCDGAGTLPDGSPVVLHSIIGDPEWFGDETLDPRRRAGRRPDRRGLQRVAHRAGGGPVRLRVADTRPVARSITASTNRSIPAAASQHSGRPTTMASATWNGNASCVTHSSNASQRFAISRSTPDTVDR